MRPAFDLSGLETGHWYGRELRMPLPHLAEACLLGGKMNTREVMEALLRVGFRAMPALDEHHLAGR